MTTARLLTIGTEITSGEIVNSNAAWLSMELEELGVRVLSHITVRDQRDELLQALRWAADVPIVIVTGGLGPTTDDITRACVSEYLGVPLEFDERVWKELGELYQRRQLPLREAHKHQCWFPAGSERLRNPTGTALGFYARKGEQSFVVLPGPPRELETMWEEEARPRLLKVIPRSTKSWQRWTFFAVPESEVAEAVEPIIAGHDLEVGYRAQVPYVKVKLFADPDQHKTVLRQMDGLFPDAFVGRGTIDLALEVLRAWPVAQLKLEDQVSEGLLAQRLFAARRKLMASKEKTPDVVLGGDGFSLLKDGEGFRVSLAHRQWSKNQVLPYKTPLDSERGRRSAAEWALWLAIKALKSPGHGQS